MIGEEVWRLLGPTFGMDYVASRQVLKSRNGLAVKF